MEAVACLFLGVALGAGLVIALVLFAATNDAEPGAVIEHDEASK